MAKEQAGLGVGGRMQGWVCSAIDSLKRAGETETETETEAEAERERGRERNAERERERTGESTAAFKTY